MAIRIEEKREGNAPRFHQVARLMGGGGSDSDDSTPGLAYLLMMCRQLQQVDTAGRSPEVADQIDDGVPIDHVAEAYLGAVGLEQSHVG